MAISRRQKRHLRSTLDDVKKISIFSINAAKKNRKIQMGIVAAIILLLVFGIHLYTVYKTYDDYKVTGSIKVDSGTNSKYIAFGDFVVKYSNDGISYIDGTETVWNEAYEMKSPLVDKCDNYLAIADKNSNTIYIYAEDGRQGKVTTSYPIIKLEVANQGVVSALLEDADANYIEVYDKEGKVLVSHKTLLDGNGFPLSFSLSDDGTKMIVSYVSIEHGSTNTQVMFYNFSDVGQNEVDRVVGKFEQYEKTIVPMVAFMNNSDSFAVGDNILSIYKMKNKPDLKKEIKFSDDIQKVFYDEDYIGFVFANENASHPYRVDVYNLTGKKIMSENIDMNFDKITFDGKNVLMYSDMVCQIISLDGIKKFRYTFTEDISDIIPVSGSYTYLLMKNSTIEKIRLK